MCLYHGKVVDCDIESAIKDFENTGEAANSPDLFCYGMSLIENKSSLTSSHI